jgi:outer membrane protein TolC
MKTIPFFFCSLSLLFPARAELPDKPGGASPPLSLSAVTESVRAHNPAIREARAKWEALRQRVPQAAAWDDPKISGSARLGRFVEISRNGFTDQMLSAEQTIPLSGKNLSRARIAEAEAGGGLEEFRRKELDAVEQARAAFYRLVRDCSLIDLNRASEASLVQSEEISQARLKVGHEGQAEVFAAETERVQIAEARTDLERAVAEDETRLNVLMNRDAFSPLAPPAQSGSYGSPPTAARLRNLLPSRPEVRMTAAGLAAAKARLELARREWVPDPTISVQAQRYNDSQAVSEVDAGVSFSVPWVNRGKYRAGEREAESGVQAAQAAVAEARNDALGMIRVHLQKAEAAHHHLRIFESQLIPLARQTVQTNRASYETGKTGFLELVGAERSLRDVEAIYRQHLAEYRIALAEIESVVGADLGPAAWEHETLQRKAR